MDEIDFKPTSSTEYVLDSSTVLRLEINFDLSLWRLLLVKDGVIVNSSEIKNLIDNIYLVNLIGQGEYGIKFNNRDSMPEVFRVTYLKNKGVVK